MSLTIPGLRRAIPKHRAVDKVTQLRDENRLLMTRQSAAEDFFALLIQDRDEVYRCWLKAAEDRDTAEALAAKQSEEIVELRRRLAPLEAAEANANAVTVPSMVRDTSNGADQATTPIDVRPLWDALGVGPVLNPGSPYPHAA